MLKSYLEIKNWKLIDEIMDETLSFYDKLAFI